MNRSLRLLIGPVACALALTMATACSSSSKGESFPTTPNDPTATTVPIADSVGKALTKPACSLATAEQVKALLAESGTARELQSQPTYRACIWTGANSRTFSLSVIRLGKGQLGFTYAKVQGLSSAVVSGLGTRAVFLSGTTSGTENAVLAADQGSVSVSLAVNWKGTLPKSDALKENLTTLIRGVFTSLGV